MTKSTKKKIARKVTRRAPNSKEKKTTIESTVNNGYQNGKDENTQNIIPYNPETSISRIAAERQRDAIFNIFDMHIEQLKQSIGSDAQQETGKMKRAYKVLKGINKDVQKMAMKIAKQNKEGQTLSQAVRGVRNGENLRGKARATWDLVALAGGKTFGRIPVIGRAGAYASHIIRGNLHLHSELNKQYRTAKSLKVQLDTLLHDDEGLRGLRNSITSEIKAYGKQLEDFKKEGEEKLNELEEKQGKKEPLVRKLEEKYQTELGKLNLGKLHSNDLHICNDIHLLDTEIMELEQRIGEIEKKCEIAGNYIQGKRTAMGIYMAYYTEGQKVFEKLEGFLEASEQDMKGSAQISEFETIITTVATTVNHLVENYNDAMLAYSRHAVKLAENTNTLVPDKLHQPEKMIETVQNVKKAIKIQYENDPISTSKQISAALKGNNHVFPVNRQNPALTGSTGGGGNRGGGASPSYINSNESKE